MAIAITIAASCTGSHAQLHGHWRDRTSSQLASNTSSIGKQHFFSVASIGNPTTDAAARQILTTAPAASTRAISILASPGSSVSPAAPAPTKRHARGDLWHTAGHGSPWPITTVAACAGWTATARAYAYHSSCAACELRTVFFLKARARPVPSSRRVGGRLAGRRRHRVDARHRVLAPSLPRPCSRLRPTTIRGREWDTIELYKLATEYGLVPVLRFKIEMK